MDQKVYSCCHNFLTVTQIYNSENTPIDRFYADKIAKSVFLHIFTMAFPTSLFGENVHPPPYVTCHVSCVRCQVSGVMCQVSRVRCHMSGVPCQVSRVRCHVSHVTCQMSRVRCQMSLFFFFLNKLVELVGGGSVINRTYSV